MQIHRCKFIDVQPSPITTLAFNPFVVQNDKAQDLKTIPPNCYLAVGRQNGNIELWSLALDWYREKVIYGDRQHPVETLLWLPNAQQPSNPFILTASTTASTLIVWSTQTMSPVCVCDTFGGTVWDVVYRPTTNIDEDTLGFLVVGCEDGSIKMVDFFADGQLELKKSLSRQQGRIVSLDLHPNNIIVVTGHSSSLIKIWSLETGMVTQVITLEKSLRRHPHKRPSVEDDTIVWKVKYLPDGHIISADSSGQINIWDPKFGTLIQSLHTHVADIMCLELTMNATVIYASGVDQRIVQLTKVAQPHANASSASKPFYVENVLRKFHTHDVRALAFFDKNKFAKNPILASGGHDMQLAITNTKDFAQRTTLPRRLAPWSDKPRIFLNKRKRWILSVEDHRLRIWAINQTEEHHKPMGESEHILLVLNISGSSNIIHGALSNDGQLLCYSTNKSLRIYKLNFDEKLNILKPQRVCDVPHIPAVVYTMVFSPNGNKVVLGCTNGQIVFMDVHNTADVRIEAVYDSNELQSKHNSKISPSINLLTLSPDGQWLSCARTDGTTFIYNMDTLQLQCVVPPLPSTPTSLTFHPTECSMLVITVTTNAFFIYDIDNESWTDWSKEYSQNLPRKWMDRKDKILGVCFNQETAASGDEMMSDSADDMPLTDITSHTPNPRIRDIASERQLPPTPPLSPPKKVNHPSSNVLWLWTNRCLCRVDLQMPLRNKRTKRKREAKLPLFPTLNSEESQPPADESLQLNFFTITKYQPILFFDFLSPSEAVVVERPWMDVILNSEDKSLDVQEFGRG